MKTHDFFPNFYLAQGTQAAQVRAEIGMDKDVNEFPRFRIKTKTDSASAGQIFTFCDQREGGPLAADEYTIGFDALNDADETFNIATLDFISKDITNNAEVGALAFNTMKAGTLTEVMRFDENVHINSKELMSFNIDSDADDDDKFFGWFNDGVSSTGTEIMRLDEKRNLGVGVTAFGTNANTVLAIGLGTYPDSQPENIIQIYARDTVGEKTTLGLDTEQDIEGSAPTINSKLLIWVNGVACYLPLQT